MKAWVLHGIGDFRLETAERPVLKEGEVLVEVKAAGICGSDIPRIYQTGAHCHPLIPGHEFSGVVTEGEGEWGSRWTGKRVGVFPLIPCKDCIPCRKKQYEMCRNYSYLGSRRDGGFAEYVAVPAANLLELPDTVSYEEAAMLEPMAVAVHAMRQGMSCVDRKAEPGEEGRARLKGEERKDGLPLSETGTVAVCGLGTIGLLLVMFLVEAGIRHILVIGNKESQKKHILRMGIPETSYCDSRKEDVKKWLSQRTRGRGVDMFFECVGKNETVSQGIDSAAPGGCVCLAGNPYSDMELEKQVYWKILRNQLTITGTWNSSFAFSDCTGKGLNKETEDDWHYVLGKLSQKRIAPAEFISHRFSFENLEQGCGIIKNKSEDYIKIMAIMKK